MSHVGHASTKAECDIQLDRLMIALKEARRYRNRPLVLMYEDQILEIEAEKAALQD